MLERFNASNEFTYHKLTPEEQRSRGILGRLAGMIADYKNPTRNGRRYDEELWEKVFNDPIMKEKIANRCVFGELGHPVDRDEIDMEKVCICLAEQPKKGSDGKLYGVFDILDTPNGRILKTFCDYGCAIGVSSRGTGDTYIDANGDEAVDAASYNCECWDAVLLPAVKDARPKYVTESLQSMKPLKQALKEELEHSDVDARKIMEKTLEELNIDYSPEQEECSEEDKTSSIRNNPEKGDNIDEGSTILAAEDSGATIVRELQEALKKQSELEKQVKTLQEQLSVCYTKETRFSEAIRASREALAASEAKVRNLSEQIEEANKSIAQRTAALGQQEKKIQTLQESLNSQGSSKVKLDEQLVQRDNTIQTLKEELRKAHAQQEADKAESERIINEHKSNYGTLQNENKKLNEALAESKKDSQIIRSQSSAKIAQSKQLVEKYKSIAKTAVDKYIVLQAKRLGIDASDIRNRLSESYSFQDIDKVCESLQKYKLTVNSLPFNVASGKDSQVRMQIRESTKERIKPRNDGIDDDIDEGLKTFLS